MRTRLPFLTVLWLFLATLSATAQQRPVASLFVEDAAAQAAAAPSALRAALTQARPLTLDVPALAAALATAPAQNRAGTAPLTLVLPLPDGTSGRFAVWQTALMEPALAVQFPQIKTYSGVGLDDPTATVQLDLTPRGFHAQILSDAHGTVYIDPVTRTDTQHYLSFFRTAMPAAQLHCGTVGTAAPLNRAAGPRTAQRTSGTVLRTYRLAMAATGEYTTFHGGTVTLALAAIVTTVNRVRGVYEKELAVSFTLVNNTAIIFTNAGTDPYTNTSSDLSVNQTTIDNAVGSANYDIGHLVGTGGGGVAQLGVVCTAGSKARGLTGSASPIGDSFDIDYVAHEMGHECGANHPFNGTGGSCGGGNRHAATAYEPGSGTTIMAYAGICGTTDNTQAHSDAYFHVVSYEEIKTYLESTSCGTMTTQSNTPPTVALPAGGKVLPISTPFKLTAVGSDINADALTYCWEEYDLGSAGSPTAAQVANDAVPLFRSFNPSSNPTRYFPRLSDLVAGTTTLGERLPTVSRPLNFRVTLRDRYTTGNTGTGVVGGVNSSATVALSCVSTAGPFQVTAPNTAVTWAGGSAQTVTWNVNSTDVAPVSCATVNIRLSTDGGLTYPTLLLAGTANDGAQAVTVPSTASTTARIMVEAADNYFFDISNVNFTISAAGTACNPPTNLSVGNITAFTATVSFAAGSGNTSYVVTTAPATTTQTVTGTSASLTGLSGGTQYTVYVQSNCAAGAVSTAATTTFTTAAPPVCNAVTNLAVGSIAATTASVSFAASSGASNYVVTTTPATSTYTATGSPVSLTGLMGGTVYTVNVLTNCANGGTATASTTFNTTPTNDECAGAINLISNLTCMTTTGVLTGVTQSQAASTCSGALSTTANDVWYSFVATGAAHTVTVNATTDVVVQAFNGTCTGLTSRSCIDNNSNGLETLNLTGLTANTRYFVRVYPYTTGTAAAAGTFTICVTGTVAATCAAPTNLSAGSVTSTSASVSFTPNTQAASYTVTTSPATTTQTITGSPATFSGLTPGTAYAVNIATNCQNGVSSAAATTTFTTTAPSCVAPTNVVVSNVTTNSASVSFTASASATSYTITTNPATTTQTVTGTTASLTGLSASTGYAVNVVSNCTGTTTNTSAAATTTFSTAAPACAAPTSLTVGSLTSTSATVSFTASGTASSYTVTTMPATTTQTVTGSSVSFSGLTPGTAYAVSIVSNCTGAATATSAAAMVTFTTAAPACAAPTSLAVSNITQTTATVNFTASSTAASYTVTTNPATTTQTVTGTTANLTGLSAGTGYAVNVVSNCNGAATATSPAATVTFSTTAPACAAPTNVAVNNVTTTTASVSFTASTTAVSYTITTVPATTTQTVTTTTANLTGLSAGTTYTVSIVSNCSGAATSTSPAATATFTTRACTAPTALSASNIGQTSASISFTGTTATSGYTVTTSPATTTQTVTGSPANLTGLTAGTTYTVSIVSNCTGAANSSPGTVSFTTLTAPACAAPTNLTVGSITQTTASVGFTASGTAASYTVTTSPATTTQTVTGTTANLTGLSASTGYAVNIVSNCTGAATSTSPAATVTFSTAAPACVAPTNVTTSNVTTTTATVSFTASGTAVSYTITTVPATTTQTVTTTTASLTGLSASTAYTVRVASNCTGVMAAPAATATFTTTAPACAAPTSLAVSNITQTTASVSFTASGTATTYTVTTSPATTTQTVTSSPVNLTGLSASTGYAVNIVSNCTNAATNTSPAAMVTFSTTATALSCPAPTGLSASGVTTNSATVNFTASSAASTYTVTTSPATTTQTVTSSPVSFSGLSANTQYTVTIVSNCPGTATGTSPAATVSFTTGLPDLLVSSALTLPAGSYHNVTITGPTTGGAGTLTLSGPLTVTGTVLVQSGGTLQTNCNPVTGPGMFTLAADATLYICSAAGISQSGTTGDILVANLRTFSPDANYIYNGTTAQSTGTGLPATVRNLSSQNAAALSLTQAVAVRQVLTLNAGDLQLGAFNLTLLSDASGTGMVVNNGTGRALNTGTGTAIVQRYIVPTTTYTGPGYRHYSSPVGNTTVADFAVTGQFVPYVNPAFNAQPTPNLPATQFPNVFDYDQGRVTPNNPQFEAGWHSPASPADALLVAKGYAVNILPTAMVDLRGQLNSGPYNTGALGRSPTANAGWQLLGNPYPAPLDWGRVSATPGAVPAGLTDAIYVFEPTSQYNGQYSSFVNGVNTGSFNGILPAMQGFFIRTTAAVPAGFTFRNDFRLTAYADPLFHRTAADARPQLRLALTSPAAPAFAADETVLYLEAGASAIGPDPHFDAAKIANPGAALSLASLMPGPTEEALAINGLPRVGPADAARLVPLQLAVPAPGAYQLAATSLLNFAPGQPVQLLDRTTGASIDLHQQATYRFTTAQAGSLPGRFAVLLGRPGSVTAAGRATALEFSLWPNPAQGHAALHLQLAQAATTATATLRDVLGRPVATQHFGGSTVEIPTTGLPTGTYLLTLTIPGQAPATRRVVVE